MRTLSQHFKGKTLIDALQHQEVLHQCPEIARRVAKCSKAWDIPKGEVLIKDGADEKDVFLVLRGRFDIKIGNERVNSRSENEHVGEMALLRGGKRTATVVASEGSSVVHIRSEDFQRLAGSNPCIWKNLARTLAKRLDQRRALLREPNETPHIFVASSTEGRGVASALKRRLTTSFGSSPMGAGDWWRSPWRWRQDAAAVRGAEYDD